MTRVLEALRHFFAKDSPVSPLADGLLHGGLNSASRNELFYAQLIEGRREDRFRDYPWPPGWLS